MVSEKHIKLIKPTRDGRWWAMGMVVDTLDEAFDRCDRKGKSFAYHIEEASEGFTCGLLSDSREWLKNALEVS